MSLAKPVFGFATIALALMVPGLGRAQTCASNADCAKGLSCQTDAPSPTAPAICYPGDGGTTCAPLADPAPATKSCQPTACASDVDCGADMVCFSQTVSTCTGGTPTTVRCEPGATCPVAPAPEPATCTQSTTSRCAYRWQLACNLDTDCGEGFVCKPTQIGMCSGSAGVAAPGSTGGSSSGTGGAASSTGGTAAEPAVLDAGTPVTCTTVESFPGYCQAKVTSCATNADCPSVWTCASANQTTAVSSGPLGLDAGVAVAAPPVTTVMTCQAPGTYGTRDTTSVPTVGGITPKGGTENGSVDAGTAVGTNVPPTPNVPGTTNSNPTQVGASTSGGGGCSVALGGGAGGAAWIMGLLLGLGVLAGRKRRT